MKNKKGFTLAEVLITLTIIGIIATITLPSLSLDVQRQKIGPALAKAVNTLENTHMDLLRETESSNLKIACDFTSQNKSGTYLSCLLNKTGISGYSTKLTTNGGSTFDCIQTKDGIAFCVYDSMLVFTPETKRKIYYGEYLNLIIDTNGTEKKPNKTGADLFTFLIDYQGNLIPEGGREYNEYMYANPTKNPAWKNTCDENKLTVASNCAGSIVDNGWKVIYPY